MQSSLKIFFWSVITKKTLVKWNLQEEKLYIHIYVCERWPCLLSFAQADVHALPSEVFAPELQALSAKQMTMQCLSCWFCLSSSHAVISQLERSRLPLLVLAFDSILHTLIPAFPFSHAELHCASCLTADSAVKTFNESSRIICVYPCL